MSTDLFKALFQGSQTWHELGVNDGDNPVRYFISKEGVGSAVFDLEYADGEVHTFKVNIERML